MFGSKLKKIHFDFFLRTIVVPFCVVRLVMLKMCLTAKKDHK